MIAFENTIVIKRPLEVVFAFIADFENVPMWNYYVKSVRKVSEGPTCEGTIYHQIRKNDQQDFRITEYQSSQLIEVETTPESRPYFKRRLMFEQIDDRTRIVDTWKLDLGQNQLVQRLATPRVKSAVLDNLGKLKELLETGQTQLQDGRTVRA